MRKPSTAARVTPGSGAPDPPPPDLLRCAWAEGSASLRAYHDAEWGVPLHDDRALFELLCLEGAQAGLSWRSVLDRRDGYRAAYHGFAIARVAAMSDAELEAVLAGAGVIRNRLKVFSVRANAHAALGVIAAEGSLDAFLWSFVAGCPIVTRRAGAAPPARTAISEHMSRELRRRGFRFVGPTICYAFMQAAGLVDDHVAACFRAADRYTNPPRD
ncbi:MAG: DNA-3-methyladenine glycosylase I [Proteobacteria bacterium]|nr:DNA-3-methyladenine glycosylase I [Pseudomonadota bacterium]